MLKLKSIYLKGFKSFGRPSILNFSDRITAIVGPNGSGKSNLIDAIRWVFGEQSKKELRASEKFDVLFSGSENLPPAGSAYVELVFEDDAGEVRVARELKRTGENYYYLNGVPTRLKDIRDKFAGTGLGVDFYSIVSQGQIDRIVNASPEELRLLLEEAAEISIYREKKRETVLRLEHTTVNLERLKDILFEKEQTLKSLYLKAKRAERYREYSSRLEVLKKVYYGNILKREKRKLKLLQEEEEATNTKIRQIQKELVTLETHWQALRQEFSKVDREIENFTRLLEDYKKRQNDLLEMKNLYLSRLNESENKYVELSTKLVNLERKKEELSKRLEEMDYIFKGIVGELSQKEKELEILEQRKREILSKFNEKERKYLELQETISTLEKNQLKLENELFRIDENLEDLAKRKKMTENQISLKRKELEGKKLEFQEISKRMETLDGKERLLAEELRAIRARLEEEETKLREYVLELEENKKRLKELFFEREILEKNLREYRDFSRAVREIFKEKESFPGLVDVVANLLEVDEDYSLAISVLLGGSAQNVVVENVETAKRIVEFLKQNALGRVTLLPLDLIDGSFKKVEGMEKERGFVGYAVDLVKVEDRYASIPGFLFGNAVVVETLDDAIELKKKYKMNIRIATLDGQLVSGRGAITGGSLETEENVFEKKIKLKHLEEELNALEGRLEDLEKIIGDKNSEVEELRNHERLVEKELFETTAKSSSLRTIVADILKDMERIQNEIESLEQLFSEYQAKEEGYRARREKIFEELEEIKTQREKILKEFSEQTEELRKEKENIEKLNEEYFNLKAEVGSLLETKQRYEKEMKDLVRSLENIAKEIEHLRAEISKLEEELEKQRQVIRKHESELEALRKEMDEVFEAMKLHHSGKEDKMRQLQELERQINELKEERERLRDYLHQLDLSLQETQLKISNVISSFSHDEEEVQELSESELETIYSEIQDLENKIKYLGPVDLSAIEEYNKLREEYDTLMKQKEDLEEAKRKLEEIIERTDREAENALLDVYQKVNESFNRMIALLFFGGEGRLRMLSEGKSILDAGFEISVRKPGRKDQKLSLLSGGEKALVGIALVFALMEIKPSPFYVLDEVDAPLDDYNAERFKKLLREYSKKTQFIVITHNKIVMEVADVLHGITMVNGVSAVVPVEVEKVLEV